MRCARAMTLVEVLGALAILVVLSGGVIGFFLQVTGRRDQLVRLSAQQRDVAAFLDRLESALMTAVTVAPDGTAGVTGDDRSITIVARSVSAVIAGEGALADAARLTLAFEEAQARCNCTLESLAGEDAPVSEPIIEHVERIRMRYSDGRSWMPTCDSLAAGALPVAIEVSIWLEPRAGPRPAPGSGQEPPAPAPEDDPGADPDDERGPLDLPPPEPEEDWWIPREPDHVRIILVPDAPATGWGGPPA